MNIAETFNFDKEGRVESKGRQWVRKLFLSLVIILTASLAFAIGRLTSSSSSAPIKVELDPSLTSQTDPSPKALQASITAPSPDTVYASSKGKKYYYEACSGLKRVSETNKISFPSAQVAEASGYTLAVGCQKP